MSANDVPSEKIQRILKPPSGPLIAMSLVGLPMSIMAAWALFKWGVNGETLKTIGIGLFFFAFIISVVGGMRLTVYDDGIAFRQFFIFTSRIPFNRVDHSTVEYWSDKDHPIFLTLFENGGEKLLIKIPLKNFPKADAQWLAGNKALKIRAVRPGI